MDDRTTRAPGSLFIAGEYAVLVGGVSVVAAVDRYAIARKNSEKDHYRVDNFSFESERLPSAVRTVLGMQETETDDVTMNVDGFYRDDQKLGLSSSAASIVALAKLLNPNVTEAQVINAHHKFQSKRGSGVDVRAAYRGGIWSIGTIGVQSPFPTVFPGCGERELRFPNSLRIEAVWLGKPAATIPMIDRLIKKIDRAETLNALKAISHASRELSDAFIANDGDLSLRALREATRAMRELGDCCEMPIFIDAHSQLESVVPDSFVVKPSGAGGGDFSLIMGPADADWDGLNLTFEPLQFGAEL